MFLPLHLHCAGSELPGLSRKTRKLAGIIARLSFLLVCLITSAAAQQKGSNQVDYSRNPEWFPRVLTPYQAQKVPAIQFTNSQGLMQMIQGSRLRISLAQLKAAVSENNLDILSSRYSLGYAQTDLLRAKGGGAPRGGAGVQIPSSLFAGAIGAGVGGVSGLGGFGGAGGITGGARQVFGVARGSYDPSIAFGFSFDRTTSPLNSIVVSGLPEVSTNSTAFLARYSQAFTAGSSISVSFNNMRQSSNQRFLLYNPYFVSQLSISFTQQLLNGFGFSTGRRFLEVAKNETRIMQESLRLQINTTLAQAQSFYWDLVAARENVRVAEKSLEVARNLFENNKTREEMGASSGLDVITAESEVAARQRDLVNAQTTAQMREVDLQNVISKDLRQILWPVQIEPVDKLPDPRESDIPKLQDALETAQSNRAEIRQAEYNLYTQDIAIRYEKDSLRPTLLFFANFNSSGLYGNQVIQDSTGGTIILPGGIFQSWRQVGRWTYPEYAVGFSFSLNVRNRAAEADMYRAKRERQQTETSLQRTRNNIAMEVRKALIGLIQSKAQVEAAHNAVELSGQALAAEEGRLAEGVSIPYDVIRRQRDFQSSQYAEVQARANYAKALVERDRAMGILEPPSTK
jgi:outer membrane protein TolC